MAYSSAHGASLPLFASLQRVEGRPAWDVSSCLLQSLSDLNLLDDIQVVLVLDREAKISLEASTTRGKEVLSELRSRSQFLPCPEGECEYGPNSSMCKWCGSPVK